MTTRGLFANFVDKTLLFVVSGFLAIAIAGFFVRNVATILVVGVTVALSLTALLSLRLHKKQSSIDSKLIKECMVQFYLRDDAFCIDSIFSAIRVRYKNAILNGEFTMIGKIAIYAYLKPRPLSVEKFCDIFKQVPKGTRRVIILTANGTSTETRSFVGGLVLKPYVFTSSAVQTYLLLKKLHSLPIVEFKRKPARRTAKLFFCEALSPPAARRYLMTALLLVGSSFFMPASIYFLVVGSVCVVLSVLAAMDVGGKIK